MYIILLNDKRYPKQAKLSVTVFKQKFHPSLTIFVAQHASPQLSFKFNCTILLFVYHRNENIVEKQGTLFAHTSDVYDAASKAKRKCILYFNIWSARAAAATTKGRKGGGCRSQVAQIVVTHAPKPKQTKAGRGKVKWKLGKTRTDRVCACGSKGQPGTGRRS